MELQEAITYYTDSFRMAVALSVIENIAANECIGPRRHAKERCLPCEIYQYAHSASDCKHDEWFKQTEEMYKKVMS